MSQVSHSNIKRWHTSKKGLLNFKINISAFSGRRRQRWSDIMSLTVLKSLSDRTLVGGGARNFCASGDNWENLCMFIFHHRWSRIILTADEWLWQELIQFCTYAVTISCRLSCSWHVLKTEVLCRNNSRDWILFACQQAVHYYSQRWKIPVEVPVLLAVVKNIAIWDSCPKSSQIRSKFWPEPDLAGFPKNGRIPDLPEPELKSGTSLVIFDIFCIFLLSTVLNFKPNYNVEHPTNQTFQCQFNCNL